MALARFLFLSAIILLIPLQMPAAGGDLSVVNVSATILSKNKCRFDTKKPTIDFGMLDPSNAVVRNESVVVSFVCNGAASPVTYAMTDDGGQDGYKMTHTSDPAQKIPYTLTINPASGTGLIKGDLYDVTISVNILGADYQSALVGPYSDSVTLTLLP